jgi:hypothetical protein
MTEKEIMQAEIVMLQQAVSLLLTVVGQITDRLAEIDRNNFVAFGVNGPDGIWSTGTCPAARLRSLIEENPNIQRLSVPTSMEEAVAIAKAFDERASQGMGTA